MPVVVVVEYHMHQVQVILLMVMVRVKDMMPALHMAVVNLGAMDMATVMDTMVTVMDVDGAEVVGMVVVMVTHGVIGMDTMVVIHIH